MKSCPPGTLDSSTVMPASRAAAANFCWDSMSPGAELSPVPMRSHTRTEWLAGCVCTMAMES